MTVTSLMTADELLHMRDDGFRYELVRGELRKMSPSGSAHGRIAGRISGSLGSHVRQRRLGEIFVADAGFRIARSPDTVRAPDVGFVRSERVVDTPKFFEGAPDIAFEVISPSDIYTEVDEKTKEWLAAGTQAVVIVNPSQKSVRIIRAEQIVDVTDVLALDDIVPGWRLPLTELFE